MSTTQFDLVPNFVKEINILAVLAHRNSEAHGFWKDEPNPSGVTWKLSRIALMHSELSECLEGVRKNLKDDHLPERSMEVCELADTIIRILDYAGAYNLPLGEVILEKMAYNAKRPFMHGDKLA
jgi:NTP pyrophosphatase (non-canonical NTP hydrolase)